MPWKLKLLSGLGQSFLSWPNLPHLPQRPDLELSRRFVNAVSNSSWPSMSPLSLAISRSVLMTLQRSVNPCGNDLWDDGERARNRCSIIAFSEYRSLSLLPASLRRRLS